MASSRTLMSGVVDHSSMGLNLGTEIEITRNTFLALKKAMYAAATNGTKYNVKFVGGEPAITTKYVLLYPNSDGSINSIIYEFKQLNKSYLLSVSGNPTRCLTGRNDIPPLVVNSIFELKSGTTNKDKVERYNIAAVTFKYLNRIMYAILDWLLEDFGFTWSGQDKDNLVKGNINITSYQIAWYSGDLGNLRPVILRHLRTIYGSQDSTDLSVTPIASAIGLNTRVWNNSEGNLSIDAWTGDRRAFSLTWYMKDQHPDYASTDNARKDRVSRLIRWDCTLNHMFLANNKIKTISALEEKYIAKCEAAGKYDTGFIAYIRNLVTERIKFDHLIRLERDSYVRATDALEELDGKYERMLAKHWLNYGQAFNSYSEAVTAFNAQLEASGSNSRLTDKNRARYLDAKRAILKLGIDVDIPRTYYEAVLFNRAVAMITREDREDINRRRFNKAPRFDELQDRDAARVAEIAEVVKSASSIGNIRKFKPDKMKPGEFWILTNKLSVDFSNSKNR